MTLSKLFIFSIFFILSISINYSIAQEVIFSKEDTLDCEQKICQYKEFEEQGKYDEAVALWKETYLKFRNLNKRLFIHGIDYICEKIENEPEKNKKFLVDSLMCLYEERIRIFGQEGFVRGRQGVDLYRYEKTRIEECFKLFELSIHLQHFNSEPAIVLCYLQSASQLLIKEKIPISDFDSIYFLCDAILKRQLKESLTDTIQVKMAISGGNRIYERFTPRENCEHLLPIIYNRIESEKFTEKEFLKLLKLIEILKCEDITVYDEIVNQVNIIRLRKINSSLPKRIQEIEKESDIECRARKYFSIGLLYCSYKQYQNAILFIDKSIELDMYNIFYYKYLFELYLKQYSDTSCSSNFEVYWVIVDKLKKVPEGDERKMKKINNLIVEYSQKFPTKEELEKLGLKPGDEHYIGGWIKEKTTVRAREN